jgi:lantibiotic modifying enzyme
VVADAVTEAAFAQAALNIGRQLCDSAEPTATGCSWTGPVPAGADGDELTIAHGDIGPMLYDGTAGIAVALAACALTGQREPFAGTAVHALSYALADTDEMLGADRLGMFDGAAGIAWSAAVVAKVLDEQPLRDQAVHLATRIGQRLSRGAPAGAEVDLIGGRAGTLLGLHGCAAELGMPPPDLSAALDDLVYAAEPQIWGIAWRTGAAAGRPPLVGLGHGAAGIALALGESAGSRTEIAAACAQALEYERSWFEPEPPAWPDLRNAGEDGDPIPGMTAWCHGAIGIGLSRARLTALISDDPRLVVELSAALQAARNATVQIGTALRDGSVSDCTPCHGLAGIAELMLAAERVFGVPDHGHAARRVAKLMLEQHAANHETWPCGLPGGGEVRGLMTGTAGIALTLLRVAGITAVPTPLLPGPSGW